MRTRGVLTIGEAAERSGVPPKTIRYYEDIGLIQPAVRQENGYRSYDEQDVATLRFVGRARALGFTLKDIEALLALYRDRNRSSQDVKEVALRHVAQIERKIAELTAIRDVIADLAARCHGDERPECPILQDLGATTH